MGWKRCPRCELNYIQEDQTLCAVCKKEMMGTVEEDFSEICIVCGEHKVVPGGDLCVRCMEEEKVLYANDQDGDEQAPPEDTESETEEEQPEVCEESIEIPLEELEKMEEELGGDEEQEEMA